MTQLINQTKVIAQRIVIIGLVFICATYIVTQHTPEPAQAQSQPEQLEVEKIIETIEQPKQEAPKEDQPVKEEPKEEPVKVEQNQAPVSNPEPVQQAAPLQPAAARAPQSSFIETAQKLLCSNGTAAIPFELAQAMETAAAEFGINPRYLLAIGLSENACNPWAVGDNGCSFGAYQGNACSGRGRWNEVHYGLIFKDCMLDYLCASKWTANRIVKQYCGSTNCPSWINQLAIHNGNPPHDWYYGKIERNGLAAGLTY